MNVEIRILIKILSINKYKKNKTFDKEKINL